MLDPSGDQLAPAMPWLAGSSTIGRIFPDVGSMAESVVRRSCTAEWTCSEDKAQRVAIWFLGHRVWLAGDSWLG